MGKSICQLGPPNLGDLPNCAFEIIRSMFIGHKKMIKYTQQELSSEEVVVVIFLMYIDLGQLFYKREQVYCRFSA